MQKVTPYLRLSLSIIGVAVLLSDYIGVLQYWIPKKIYSFLNSNGIVIIALSIAILVWLPFKTSRERRLEREFRRFASNTRKSLKEYQSKILKAEMDGKLQGLPEGITGPFSDVIDIRYKQLFEEWQELQKERDKHSINDRQKSINLASGISRILKIQVWRDRLYKDIDQFDRFVTHVLEKKAILEDFYLVACRNSEGWRRNITWEQVEYLIEEHISNLELKSQWLD